ncbi:MAG: hypothetical protein C5B60_09050 [Chloroflexi bacterium]|nr:MAG: hypothetical protein C5B60_09050 [Chloroflexota bacterium]
MQNQHIGQEKHRARSLEQELGVKSCWSGRSGLATVWPVTAWVIVLAVGVMALRGAGQIPTAQAAGASDHESEATLGAKHGERRQNNCILIVPRNPLTASGLATPYQLKPGNSSPCHESIPATAVFVQAAVLDPATGQISIYDPLVTDQGTKAAAQPVLPKLPANAVVGIWFGSNGTGLHLQGSDGGTLSAGQCVNGLGSSVFGQVAYCNAPAFFAEANQLIGAGKLTPPPLGTAVDGMACPSVRNFSVVDQDPSDNVTTSYLITQDGRLAQDTAANRTLLPGSAAFGNGSDNRLLAIALDAALGCTPWEAPDLADPGQMVTAQPLNELQAAMYQAVPVAYVPSADPMALVNGQPSLAKLNLYRAGVDQPEESSATQASADQLAFCQNVLSIAPARIAADKAWTISATSLDSAVANNLFTFLAARLSVTIGPDGLNCTSLLNVANPVQLTQANGIVVDASFSASTTPTPSAMTSATGITTTPMKGA